MNKISIVIYVALILVTSTGAFFIGKKNGEGRKNEIIKSVHAIATSGYAGDKNARELFESLYRHKDQIDDVELRNAIESFYKDFEHSKSR